MKVLWVTSEYRPRIGGIERYVETTTRQLSETMTVGLVTGAGQYVKQPTTVLHAGALNLSNISSQVELAATRASLREIAGHVRPSLIHLASAGLAVFAPDLADIAPLVCTVHGSDLTWPWQKLPGGDVREEIARGLRRCRSIIAVSECTAAHVLRRIPDSPVIVIRHGIDLEESPASRAPAIAGSLPRVLTVSRLVPRKAHNLLLRALERVRIPCHWDIVGTGLMESRLKAEVDRSSIRDRVDIPWLGGG